MTESSKDAAPIDKHDQPPKAFLCLGASAGGLASLKSFFKSLAHTPLPNVAIILVQHLMPNRKSDLSEIISHCTQLPVHEVTDEIQARGNNVYVIEPGTELTIDSGWFRVKHIKATSGPRFSIDSTFSSIARYAKNQSIGVVLSGSGHDGTSGLKAIKEHGGLAIAESLKSAKFVSMPKSAIEGGFVDYQLTPKDMPSVILDTMSLATVDEKQQVENYEITESQFVKILTLINDTAERDFSGYKPSSLSRGILRLMAQKRVATVDEYIGLLGDSKSECEELASSLLIGVTAFFRDPDVFEKLRRIVIEPLFTSAVEGQVLRFWIPACSTGEEAYTITMCLEEQLRIQNKRLAVQVFATDIDKQALDTARLGQYPKEIEGCIAPEYLQRYFDLNNDLQIYVVKKQLRDKVIFSEQDAVLDPPFSRLDLISCRNMLIYLSSVTQKHVLSLFHYALKPLGYLLIGGSEYIDDESDHYQLVDKSAKLYVKRPNSLVTIPFSAGVSEPSSLAKKSNAGIPVVSSLTPQNITEQAILSLAPVSAALLNESGEIYYLHGRMGQYLELPAGNFIPKKIMEIGKPALRSELTATFYHCVSQNEESRLAGLFNLGDTSADIEIVVAPIDKIYAEMKGHSLYLLQIIERPNREAPFPDTKTNLSLDELGNEDKGALILSLLQQLKAKDLHIDASNLALESRNQELNTKNQDMQSINEELQATNEELETSKEELQSLNEELSTVNDELQKKIEDLSNLNNDMNNLLAGTGIATVFVDLRQCIMRYTPKASKIINLRSEDIGRPLEDITNKLVDRNILSSAIEHVLQTLETQYQKVQVTNGDLYTMNTLPYRIKNNAVNGCVITFTPISNSVPNKKMD